MEVKLKMHCYLWVLFTLLFCLQTRAVSLKNERRQHRAVSVNSSQLIALSQASDVENLEYFLDSILIPRVVGSPGHTQVKQFIIENMKNMGWHVETDKFTDKTPTFGVLEFENIIASLNPNARRFLVLACHYDTKYFREREFVGATDSAVPCAMMMNIAFTMKNYFKKIKNKNDLSLRLIFFDGEEAFRHWGPTDSIYGARHLAAKWEKQKYPPGSNSGLNELDRLDVLVLLDLLGAPDPVFYSYFEQTEEWYRLLSETEDKLSQLGLLERYSTGQPEQRYFQLASSPSSVEDDHVPFMRRNVPVLHLIPIRFPEVWHTSDDNKNFIDMSTVENLTKILRVFVYRYLGSEKQSK